MYNRNTSLRLTGTIFITQSLFSAAQIAILTLLTIMAAELSGRDSLAGIPVTINTLAVAIASYPVGILMGKFGRRFGLTISYGISILGAILGVFAILQGWFWLLIVSAAGIGIGRAGGSQSRFIAGDLFFENERARMIGVIVFAGTMGAIFGPQMVVPGGQLSTYLGFDPNTGPWVIAAIFYTLATILTFIMLRPEPMKIAKIIEIEEDRRKKKKRDENDKGRPVRELLKLPRVQLAVISMLISQVVMVMLMVMTPLHMVNHGHSTANVSIVITAHTLGMFGLSAVTGYLIDRLGRVPMMVVGALTLLTAAIISPLGTQMPFLVIGLFLLGLGWNFGYVAGSSLLSDALEGVESTRMQGANDMFVSGAAALGSFSSGPIFATGGFITVAGLGIVVVLIFVWLIRLLAPQQSIPTITDELQNQ
ncbi:MAG: MFS transporter [Phototrophicaceae bacterium]